MFGLHVCAPVCMPDGLGGQMSTLGPLDLELSLYKWVLGAKPMSSAIAADAVPPAPHKIYI